MNLHRYAALALACLGVLQASAYTATNDPDCCVDGWSENYSDYAQIIDINFTDISWPNTWGDLGTAINCPEYSSGLYVNAVIDVAANGGDEVSYPVLFHNCTFATKAAYNGYACTTAAFARMYYEGQSACGNTTYGYNNWTVDGHLTKLEENVEYSTSGTPIYGEAGFVQMCRTADYLGWVEIDHLPYVDALQWSFSSTSWGRGIKCDIKIGDGDWEPLVWMGSEKQKVGYTSFSDQGYFIENKIEQSDVSLRWRVWDGEVADDPVQSSVFTTIGNVATCQAPRVHKIKIFGQELTADDATYATENQVSDVGELSDLDDFMVKEPVYAPDEDAEVVIYYVNPDGSGDFTTIQSAIDAVGDGMRGIIYIAAGTYDEHVFAGTKTSHASYISLIGEDAATTILTSSVERETTDNTYLDCTALNIFCERFYAENLTIENTSGSVGRAEALYTNGDAHIFKNCIISGYQDTYKANVGSRGYFIGCTIKGATDFIYDGGLEWFEDCDIVCLNKSTGYITAPAESGMPMSQVLYPSLERATFYPGLFISNSRITAEDGTADGTYYLGRPWGQTSGAMFLNCTLGSHIRAVGWSDMSDNASSSSLGEYNNVDASGVAVDVSSRASFSFQASAAEVEAYMNPEFLFENFSDVPFDFATILSGATEPYDFTVSSEYITWQSDAAAYLIYINGKLATITTDTKYTLAGEDAENVTIKAVSRHGVTSEAVGPGQATKVLAFPTAEGFGKYATGGRGGQVVKVTSLADDGSEGTLRWAFSQYSSQPITIVFDVCGEISLQSELKVNRSNWTLAGQSAPGQGVVITHNKVNFGGSQNFIVRNVRFRIGQKDANGDVVMDNACGAENCSNFIFDHCSFGWSVEENMNTADSHFLTVQYSIVHEGLYNAGHSKGVRGYGCQWGGSPATYHHNLLAHNYSRSSRINGARGEDYVVFMEYVNNVNYNFGKNNSCYGGENTADITEYNGLNSAHECNFMNNYYKNGPVFSSQPYFFMSSYARDGATSWAPAQWYVDGNVAEGFDAITADNWSGISVETYTLAQIKADERITTATPYYKWTATSTSGDYTPETYMMYDFQTAAEAYETVVGTAGTVNRDKVETRVVNDVRNGSYTYAGSAMGKGIIDTENDAEGFFDYADAQPLTDTDNDGMPDEWETANGFDPSDASDRNTLNDEGYTALEVYLNSLMGETTDYDFTQDAVADVKVITNSVNLAGDILTVGDDAIGAALSIYTTDGRCVSSRTIKANETELSNLPSGVVLIKVEGKNITPVVLKTLR